MKQINISLKLKLFWQNMWNNFYKIWVSKNLILLTHFFNLMTAYKLVHQLKFVRSTYWQHQLKYYHLRVSSECMNARIRKPV